MQVIFFNCVGYRCKNVSAVMELGVSLTCFWKPTATAFFFSDRLIPSTFPKFLWD
jgi:hypothetical protein